LNALPSRPISCGDGDTPWKRHLSPRRVVAGSRGRGFQARPAGSTPRYVGNSTQVSAFEMLCVCRRRLTRPPSNCHRSVWFGSIAPKLPKPRRRVCMNSRQRSAYRDGSLQHRRNGRERLRRLCGGCTSGEVARSPYVSGRRVTPGKQQRSIHTERGTGIRNPFCRSHKSNMVSIVATHSWRPRWVKGCRCDYVGSTSGVPQIADDLSRRSTRQPWPTAELAGGSFDQLVGQREQHRRCIEVKPAIRLLEPWELK